MRVGTHSAAAALSQEQRSQRERGARCTRLSAIDASSVLFWFSGGERFIMGSGRWVSVPHSSQAQHAVGSSSQSVVAAAKEQCERGLQPTHMFAVRRMTSPAAAAAAAGLAAAQRAASLWLPSHFARRDKRKKKTGKKPGAGDAKTERKTERNEEKKSRRLERAAQVHCRRHMRGPAAEWAAGCTAACRVLASTQATAGFCKHGCWQCNASSLQPVTCKPAPHPPTHTTTTATHSPRPQVLGPRYLQGGEDDIDALLAKFKLQDERHSAVSIKENCAAPSPRVYASLTPIPSQASQKGGFPCCHSCSLHFQLGGRCASSLHEGRLHQAAPPACAWAPPSLACALFLAKTP